MLSAARRALAAMVIVMVVAVVATPAPDVDAAARRGASRARTHASQRSARPARTRPRAAAASEAALLLGDGSGVTGSRDIVVHATVPDDGAHDREYELAEAGAPAGDWLPWPGGDDVDLPFTVSTGDGPKEVVLRHRSTNGSLTLRATIRLDTTPPEVAVVAEDGGRVTRDRIVGVDIEATDASELRRVAVSTDRGAHFGDEMPFERHLSVRLPSGTRSGPVRVVVAVRDAARNVGTGADVVTFRPRPAATMDLRLDYRLKTRLRYRRGTLAVRETIGLENRTGRLITDLNLYLMPRAFGELTRGPSVRVDGERVHGRWTTSANLRVTLPAPLAKGEGATVALRFGLRASARTTTSLEARLAKGHGMMTVGHWFATVGAGYPARYPGDALVAPVADSIVLELHHDRRLVVAAPGRLTDRSPTYDRYVLAPARDFAFAVSPRYHHVSGAAAGAHVDVYARSRSAARAALAPARLALARYAGALGRYGWSRLVIAESPWAPHATEYSGFLMIGSPGLHDRLTVAHEVAHEWFQAMVGDDQFAEPWLDEGTAEFISRLYFAGPVPYCSSRPIDTPIFAYPDVQMLTLAAHCGSYYQTTYLKAQAMFYGLRARMGQGPLLGAFHEAVSDYRWRFLTTKAMRAILERHGAPHAYLARFLRGG